jgi:hypothetical protein
MTTIAVEIKTLKDATRCSQRCEFFHPGVMSDHCNLFGPLARAHRGTNNRVTFISARAPECLLQEIRTKENL